MKQLREENLRLKQLLAELSLIKQILQDLRKMCCFCTSGLPIRAIIAISEDAISAMGGPLQLLLFSVRVAK